MAVCLVTTALGCGVSASSVPSRGDIGGGVFVASTGRRMLSSDRPVRLPLHFVRALLKAMRRNLLSNLLAVAILSSLSPVAVSAQTAGVVGNVRTSTGEPVAGVLVTIDGTDRRALTAGDGYFAILRLPSGTSTIRFEIIGFAAVDRIIELAAETVSVVDVTLSEDAVELPTIVVEAETESITPWLNDNGFGLRRYQADGVMFRTRRDLRFQSGRDIVEVLRRLDDVYIRRHSDGGSELFIGGDPREDPDACPADIYLNGAWVELGIFRWTGTRRQTALRPLRFDDLLRIDDIDGIEVYRRGESPVGTEKDCGALLLWSERLRRNLDEPFTGDLSGTVLNASGAGVAAAEVRLVPGEHVRSTGTDGRFEFTNIPPGRYTLAVVVAPGEDPWSTPVVIKAFGAVTLTVTIEREYPLSQRSHGAWRVFASSGHMPPLPRCDPCNEDFRLVSTEVGS